MEMSSTVKKTRNVSAVWGLAGCLILLLFLNQTHQKLSFLALLSEFHFHPKERCNMFDGRWVYKPEQGPCYSAAKCPFIDKSLNCQKNGRPDSDYEKWIWEARDCDIPQFDGVYMLERLRDKRMIVVGDSISRNQWESLACLLYSSVDPSRVEVKARDGATTFIAKDYNCTVEFYWSAFLVDLANTHESGRKVLVLDKISPLAERWRGAHIMVFNSGFWWTHAVKIRAWEVFEYEGQLIEEMPMELAFEMGMKTWATWMENNVDPKETKSFYRSISTEHYGKQPCGSITQPMMDESYESSRFPKSLIDIVERTLKGMRKSQVKYFNITNMSKYRRDAHPSIYKNMEWKNKTSPLGSGDCSHWCLPGLPDGWNRLLYSTLFFNT